MKNVKPKTIIFTPIPCRQGYKTPEIAYSQHTAEQTSSAGKRNHKPKKKSKGEVQVEMPTYENMESVKKCVCIFSFIFSSISCLCTECRVFSLNKINICF